MEPSVSFTVSFNPTIARTALQHKLSQAQIRFLDPRGDGCVMSLEVATRDFDGLTTLEQHRIVLNILTEAGLNCETLSIRTLPGDPRWPLP